MNNRQNMVDTALSFIGASEGTTGHKTIVSIYNKISPLPRGYKLKETDAWCAAFVSVCASVSDNLSAVPAECGCPEMLKAFEKRGEYFNIIENPRPGDIIFYDWNGDKVPDHVGIIVEVPDTTSIKVCEGNYNNSVGIRHVGIKNKNILGICKPDYKEETMPDWKTEAIKYAMEFGISDGTNPDKYCTRVECMAMCVRSVDVACNAMLQAMNEALKKMEGDK